jgi:hypothetical protein
MACKRNNINEQIGPRMLLAHNTKSAKGPRTYLSYCTWPNGSFASHGMRPSRVLQLLSRAVFQKHLPVQSYA